MWAAGGKPEIPPYIAILFFLFVIAILASYWIFQQYVAPKALGRWADEQGFKIRRMTLAGPFKRMAIRASHMQVVYRVVMLDQKGSAYSGLAKLGHYYWPASSPDRCPIEVYWDEITGPDPWDDP